MSEGPTGAAYRNNPVVDLVRVAERKPRRALVVKPGPEVLDVEIGGLGVLSRRWRAFLLYSSLVLNLLLVLAIAVEQRFPLPVPLGIGFVLFSQLVWLLNYPIDNLIVRREGTGKTRVVWKQYRTLLHLADERSAESTRITGVYNARDHIRVELDDGTSWEVGRNLKVPRPVRRWVASRVAQSLAPAARSIGDGESANALDK